jgi:hypothetical protein
LIINEPAWSAGYFSRAREVALLAARAGFCSTFIPIFVQMRFYPAAV